MPPAARVAGGAVRAAAHGVKKTSSQAWRGRTPGSGERSTSVGPPVGWARRRFHEQPVAVVVATGPHVRSAPRAPGRTFAQGPRAARLLDRWRREKFLGTTDGTYPHATDVHVGTSVAGAPRPPQGQ